MSRIIFHSDAVTDTGGKPIVGARVFVGTSVGEPIETWQGVNVYSDAEETIRIAEPIFTDAHGRIPTALYCSISYKIGVYPVDSDAPIFIAPVVNNKIDPIVELTNIIGANQIYGTGNALVPFNVYQSNHIFIFTAALANTGNVTLNVEGSGYRPILLSNGQQVPVGEFQPGDTVIVAFNTAGQHFVLINPKQVQQGLTNIPRGYLFGLELNRNAVNNRYLDIAAGECVSDDIAVNSRAFMAIPGMTKRLDEIFVAGNNSGGRLGIGSEQIGIWYHVFVIQNPVTNSTDVAFSTELNPGLPPGFTKKRRIGSIISHANGDIVEFDQKGDIFSLTDTVRVLNIVIGSVDDLTGLFAALTPIGVICRWFGVAYLAKGEGQDHASLAVTKPGITHIHASIRQHSPTATSASYLEANTDIAGQLMYAVTGGDVLTGQSVEVQTFGWVDFRGRLD